MTSKLILSLSDPSTSSAFSGVEVGDEVSAEVELTVVEKDLKRIVLAVDSIEVEEEEEPAPKKTATSETKEA